MDPIAEMITKNYEEHEKSLDPNNIRDFLDLMLVEQRNQVPVSSRKRGGHK
jgi:hypothetical protein